MKVWASLVLVSILLQPLEGKDVRKRYSLSGAVVASDGTMVRKFSVIVRPHSDKPQLVRRLHFTDGLFEIANLDRGQYKIQITSPEYTGVVFDARLTDPKNPLFSRVVVLHPVRNEVRGLVEPVFALKRVGIPAAAEDAYQRGVELHRLGKVEEAMMAYGEAIRIYPDYVDALSDIGGLYIVLNRPESAMTFLRRAARLDPENRFVRLNMASSFINQKRYSEGIRIFQQILNESAGTNLVRYFLAKAYWDQGKHDLAEQTIRTALEADPAMVDGWVLLLNVAREQGNEAAVHDSLIRLREILKNDGFTKFVNLHMTTLAANTN